MTVGGGRAVKPLGMSLIDDFREAADNLVPSHTVEINKIQGVVSSIVHYLEDPEGFLNALHSEEGAAAGLLSHFTAKADDINQKAQRDIALASGLTNVPTYQELLDVFKNAIQTGTLPPAQPVAPPTSAAPAQPTAPGAPAPAATIIPGAPAESTVPSNIPGAPPITVHTAAASPVAATGVPVVPNTGAPDAASGDGSPVAPAFQGQPTYEQLMATVQAQQALLAETEQALNATVAAQGAGAVAAGNQSTAEQG